MNTLCVRCLLEDMQGNFCPQCGQALAVAKHKPTVAELEAFQADVEWLLPRLGQVHSSLDEGRSRAIERRCLVAVERIEKRQMLLLRVDQRLREHLRFVQRELALRNGVKDDPSSTT